MFVIVSTCTHARNIKVNSIACFFQSGRFHAYDFDNTNATASTNIHNQTCHRYCVGNDCCYYIFRLVSYCVCTLFSLDLPIEEKTGFPAKTCCFKINKKKISIHENRFQLDKCNYTHFDSYSLYLCNEILRREFVNDAEKGIVIDRTRTVIKPLLLRGFF